MDELGAALRAYVEPVVSRGLGVVETDDLDRATAGKNDPSN
jgi:hypothetical protein